MYASDDFRHLPKNEKVHLLFNEGRELLVKKKAKFLVKIYVVRGQYVEIWFRKTNNRIEKMEVISEEDLLAGYRDLVNLSELVRSS